MTDTDPDNHFGARPAINLVKLTNGTDNDAAPAVRAGRQHGDLHLRRDQHGQRAAIGCDGRGRQRHARQPGRRLHRHLYVGGDTNANGLLDLTETWTFTAARIATPGQYTNLATTIGTPPPGAGAPSTTRTLTTTSAPGGSPVSDTDADNHFGTNQPPNDIAGGPLSVNENSTFGTLVGIVTGQDPNGDTLTYELTDNAGGRFASTTLARSPSQTACSSTSSRTRPTRSGFE